MLDIFAVTFPIYLIVGIGYLLTRYGLFSKADMRVFGKLVVNLALPALLLRALTQRSFSELLSTSYLLVYCFGGLCTLILGYFFARRVVQKGATASAFYGLGMASSNSGFVGYPILMLTIGNIAGEALALNMIVENLIVIPLGLLLAERGRGGAGSPLRVLQQSFLRLAKMPLIQSLILGLLISISGIHLPAPLAQTINMFANASGVLSLLVIGGALVGVPIAGMLVRVLPIVVGKQLLHPAFVALAIAALPALGLALMEPNLRHAAIMMAAMPIMGIYPTLTQADGLEEFSAAALLASTVASFFTLSALLAAMQWAA